MKAYHTYPAVDVAHVLLKCASDRGLPLTNLHLQKLAYICHGVSLSKFERPLFIEDVRAWQYGPVVPSIYIKFKEFASSPVTIEPEQVELDLESLKIVDSVIEKFGDLSAWQLVKLTHREGSPWFQVWTKERFSIISDETIKSHYDQIYEQGFAASL